MEKDRLLALVLRAVLLGLFLWMVKSILLPVALGALFALLLRPLQRRIARRPKLAKWAPLILTVGSVVLVVIPTALMATKAVVSINDFLDRDWNYVNKQVQEFVWHRLGPIRDTLGGAEQLRSSAENLVRQIGTAVAGAAGGMARALPRQIVNTFLFLLSLYYFLRDGKRLSNWLLRLSPFPRDHTEELFNSVQETVNGAILGLLATSLVQGGLTMIALFIFKVPGAFLFGVIATLLAFIPMVGTTPITIGAVLYLIANGRTGAGIAMAVAAVLIGLSDNVIRPWVQSAHSSNMHPLVVLLGIFGGLELFGAAGVFIGPVIAAMAIWIVDTYADIRTRHSSRRDSTPPSSRGEDPPPSAPAEQLPLPDPVGDG
jgi:predicted PurR-regulated permease PerM